jgi:hypothetical protein
LEELFFLIKDQGVRVAKRELSYQVTVTQAFHLLRPILNYILFYCVSEAGSPAVPLALDFATKLAFLVGAPKEELPALVQHSRVPVAALHTRDPCELAFCEKGHLSRSGHAFRISSAKLTLIVVTPGIHTALHCVSPDCDGMRLTERYLPYLKFLCE